jgi:hypothetical protein
MNDVTFAVPFNDAEMEYDATTHRYELTQKYLSSIGIDLSIILDTESAPLDVPKFFLKRVSFLVYSNIYSYGRSKEDKEYILACNPNLREVIKESLVERIAYITDSGDMSTKTGALIQQGTRINTQDLIASPQEENILRTAGILHRGNYYFIKDETLVY